MDPLLALRTWDATASDEPLHQLLALSERTVSEHTPCFAAPPAATPCEALRLQLIAGGVGEVEFSTPVVNPVYLRRRDPLTPLRITPSPDIDRRFAALWSAVDPFFTDGLRVTWDPLFHSAEVLRTATGAADSYAVKRVPSFCSFLDGFPAAHPEQRLRRKANLRLRRLGRPVTLRTTSPDRPDDVPAFCRPR